VVSSTPRPHFTPGKDPVPILQEAGWAPGPVWTGGNSRPHRDSIPDPSARRQSLYLLSYPASRYGGIIKGKKHSRKKRITNTSTVVKVLKYAEHVTISTPMNWM